jgi:hypothetical protein
MDNRLEKKIREHGAEIFGSEPMQGHRDRFIEKLQVSVDRKKHIPIRRIIGYLAVAAVFASCIFFVRDIFSSNNGVEDDLSEVHTYYSMLLQDKINAIEQLLPQIDEQDRATLMHDIETMKQEADAIIQASDDKYIDLIVTTYSSKIESLQHIQNIHLTNY